MYFIMIFTDLCFVFLSKYSSRWFSVRTVVVIGQHIERIFFLEIIITIFDRLPTHVIYLFVLKVYLILDEFILAGELQETSKKVCIILVTKHLMCGCCFKV